MARVDGVIEEIDMAMSRLRDTLTGVPWRQREFRRQHADLTEAAARLVVLMDDARSILTDWS